ncbi:DUF6792 domain-containing protein [Terribacillus saccharophilus]|uniref:DUF6792 domain-containing protein n=1 Tax=Terribacillus saccharophilus TaxID=361277 RepID=UPI002DCED096|nr:hypothetical protein [Terribacillus saccharophilus]MEC0289456.1 hypothetical protein [Terribacillus saccharophilus]
MSLDKITSTNAWMRLVNTEYDNLDPEELEVKFKSIYLEETGELFEGDVNIFHSSESKAVSETSGYDGTALLISEGNEEKLYVINQGSTDGADWNENIKGPFAGQSKAQAEATKEFVGDAKKQLGVAEESEIISLGHSLGHHNSVVTGIVDDTFDEIYGVNGLQLPPVEVYYYDLEFAKAVNSHFGLKGQDAIFDVPTKELAEFTKDYYKDAPVEVHQKISEDDPLYAVTEKAGFVTFGDVEMIDTNPEVAGIKELIDDIPADVIASFRDLAIDYSIADNKGGVNEVASQLLGVKLEYLEGIKDNMDILQWYAFDHDEFDETIKALKDNLPPLLEKVSVITQNADTIFGRLYEEGYITEDQKNIMIKEVANLEKDLSETYAAIYENADINENLNELSLYGDYRLYKAFQKLKGSFTGSIENILNSGILERLESIKESHSINDMLNALAGGSKSYSGKDLIYTTTSASGEPIEVNMSAALRLYREGALIFEDKMSAIAKLKKTVHEEIQLAFKEERKKVLDEIYHIESNPKGYAYSRGWMHRYPLYEVESLKVMDNVFPLEKAGLDEQIYEMKSSVDSGYKLIEDYRKAVEDLFAEEEKLSQMFDLVRGI